MSSMYRELTARKVGELTVDVCDGGCGGVWFDNFELQKVDESHEAAGESLLAIEKDDSVTVDDSVRGYAQNVKAKK